MSALLAAFLVAAAGCGRGEPPVAAGRAAASGSNTPSPATAPTSANAPAPGSPAGGTTGPGPSAAPGSSTGGTTGSGTPAVQGSPARATTGPGTAAAPDPKREASTPEAPAASAAAASRPDQAVVRAGPLEDLFLLTGELSAVRSLELVTPRSESWRLQIKWLVEDGAEVREGDPLVEFDNTSVAQTIEEKRLARIQTEVDLQSRRASLAADSEEKRFAVERARIGRERAASEAAVPQDLMSRREWQEKQAALRQADAALEKARLELEAFQTASKAELENLGIARDKATREIEAAQRTLGELSVRAPKPGIVVISENWNEDRKYQVGDNLWPGLTVATIPDLAQMETIGYLADVDDGRIAPGSPVRCILDTYPDRVFRGKVEEVASIADTRRGFRVRISMELSDPAIMRPGMSVRVEVIRRAWERALTVPRRAVLRRDKGTFVARAGGGEPVAVGIAACTPTDCVIESGLSEGDHVRLY